MKKREEGFTLLELVIGIGILLIAILGILSVYNHSTLLGLYSQDYALALQSAQAKMEEIRHHGTISQIMTDYAQGGALGNTFDPEGLTGKGNITFDNSTSAIGVRVSVCWSEKGRIFGEDTNLDGQFDAATEDSNPNGQLDSPVELVTYITDSS